MKITPVGSTRWLALLRVASHSKPRAHRVLNGYEIFRPKCTDAPDQLGVWDGYQVLRIETPPLRNKARTATSKRPPRGLVMCATAVTNERS